MVASHANSMATGFSKAIVKAGYDLLAGIETNQVFAILLMGLVETPQQGFNFYVREKARKSRRTTQKSRHTADSVLGHRT